MFYCTLYIAKTKFNVLSNTTKPTLLESLSQESVSSKILNDLLTNTPEPTLLESLSQDYDSLDIDNELLCNTTKFTLLDSQGQDSIAKTEFNVLSSTAKPILL